MGQVTDSLYLLLCQLQPCLNKVSVLPVQQEPDKPSYTKTCQYLAISRRSRAFLAPLVGGWRGVESSYSPPWLQVKAHLLHLTTSHCTRHHRLSVPRHLQAKVQTHLQTQTLTESKTNRKQSKSSRPLIHRSSVFPQGVEFPANATNVRLGEW